MARASSPLVIPLPMTPERVASRMARVDTADGWFDPGPAPINSLTQPSQPLQVTEVTVVSCKYGLPCGKVHSAWR